MKLLPRLALDLFDRFSLFQCRRRSVGLRSIHAVPDCGRRREPSDDDSPAAAAAKDPISWVLLSCNGCRWSNTTLVAGAKTTAECRTSTGKRLRVSFDLAAPPASSLLYYDCSETARDDKYGAALAIVAAHGDSVLLRMTRRREQPPSSTAVPYDHFVYRAGGGRPPSLTLLPDLKVLREYDDDEGIVNPNKCCPLLDEDTGILRRGNDEILVAWIEVLSGHRGGRGMASMCVLRHGRSQWEDKLVVPILHDHKEGDDELMGYYLSRPDMAIPVGDRFLCWVGYHHESFILCDMADETSPKLRHVALPWLRHDPSYYTDDLPPLTDSNSVGAAGTSAVRFVAIEPRCCCGSFGRSSCPRCQYAFTVTTWTLTLTTMDEPMTWVKDGVLDCEELWALPGYEGIPRVHLQQPIVSLDNPDVVCFKVVSYEDRKTWMIQVDTRRKAILKAVQCTTDPRRIWQPYLRPAKLQ